MRQREIITELVELFWDSGDRYLDPLFAGDWREAADDAARRRVVIDQVASLTDSTAIEWHSTLVRGEPFRRSWV